MTKPDFILTIRQLIADGKTDEALDIMRANVSLFDSSLVTDAILLESRYTNVFKDFAVKGILPREDYDRTVAQINYALLEIIEKIEKSVPPPTSAVKNKNSGRILHNIPGTMPVSKERRCIVRIAYDDESLLRDIKIDDDTTIENVRIAEVMGVELVDFNETPAFNIRTLNDEEQFICDDEYTQWLFMVKALREGKYPLTLKVCVIEEVNGKERKRDIVLEKEVFIISQIEEPAAASQVVVQPAATHFEDTTIHLNYVTTVRNRAAAATSPASKRYSFSGIASTIAVIAVALTGWVAFQTFNSTIESSSPVITTDTNSEKNSTKNTFPPSVPSVSDTITQQLNTENGELAENSNKNNPNTQPNTNGAATQTNQPKKDYEVSASTKASKPESKPLPSKKLDDSLNKSNKGKAWEKRPLPAKPTTVTNPPTKSKIKIGDIKILPQTGGDTSTTTRPKIKIGDIKTEPIFDINEKTKEPEMKTFKVRLILKGEMKKAEIFVDGQSVDRFLKKNIWGTPQYIEFKSSKESHTITFKRGNVSCSVENIMVENGDMKVEPCSFNN